jgi:hypothetical protein
MRRINIRSKRSSERGYTFAELMTVAVLAAIFFTIALAILTPLTRASTQGQAKLENVQTPAMGFYAIERDLRQADAAFTWVCDANGNGCGSSTTSSKTIIAIPTAMNSSGQVQLVNGKPLWQGFIVYWTSTDPGSPNRALYRSYQAVAITNNQPTTNDAKTAIQAANPTGPVVSDMFLTGDYSVTLSVGGNLVTLQMVTRSTYGSSTNQTSYQTTAVSRN